jgi:hypothetical protein
VLAQDRAGAVDQLFQFSGTIAGRLVIGRGRLSIEPRGDVRSGADAQPVLGVID